MGNGIIIDHQKAKESQSHRGHPGPLMPRQSFSSTEANHRQIFGVVYGTVEALRGETVGGLIPKFIYWRVRRALPD
jgi:hypothetical protein